MTWCLRALDRVWRLLGWDEPPAGEFARRYRRLHTELQAYVDAQGGDDPRINERGPRGR